MLGKDKDAGAVASLEKVSKVVRDRPTVVSDEYAICLCSNGQHLGISESQEPSLRCRLELESRLVAKSRQDDLLIEVRVGLEADLHVEETRRALASTSFRYRSGLRCRAA